MKKSIKSIGRPILAVGILLVIVGGLTSCEEEITRQMVVQGYHPNAPKPSQAELRTMYTKQLKAQGVQVIQLGETLRFVLPSDKLFNPDSANINADYQPVLKTLADLMSLYDKVNVKVASYGDNVGKLNRKQALTTRQAQVVASYLSSRDSDVRLTYAVGYSDKNSVSWNGNAKGRTFNRRVEVSFHFYPVRKPYE